MSNEKIIQPAEAQRLVEARRIAEAQAKQRQVQANNLKTALLLSLNNYRSPVKQFFARILWGITAVFTLGFFKAFDKFLDKQNLVDNAISVLEQAQTPDAIRGAVIQLIVENEDLENPCRKKDGDNILDEDEKPSAGYYSPIFMHSLPLSTGKLGSQVNDIVRSWGGEENSPKDPAPRLKPNG